MSRIAIRVLLALVVVAAIASSIIGILKKIPPKQRYPIAQVDAPLADEAPKRTIDAPVGIARNAILIIGDGMGPTAIEAARLASVGESGKLELQKLPVRGSVTTRSADSLVTDSAAAATAIATGVRTNEHMVALDPTGRKLRTILEAAEASGFVTGLVTTTDVSDATPAAFATHAKDRYDRDDIASQLITANVEILMGSNAKHFVPLTQWGGHRTDGRDLLAEAASSGTVVARNLQALRAASRLPLVAIFDESERPPLPDLALESLRLFEASGERFFLMIESEETDNATHDQDLGRTLTAVRELDQAVKVAVEWAKRDGSTVVIVTSDHDTGGLSIIPSDSPKLMHVIWATRSHTALDVELHAMGPGAEAFGGYIDNTDIAPALARVLGIESAFASH